MEDKTLIQPRSFWESDVSQNNKFAFTKKELDLAEKKDIKLIGIVNGVKCYLPPNLKPRKTA